MSPKLLCGFPLPLSWGCFLSRSGTGELVGLPLFPVWFLVLCEGLLRKHRKQLQDDALNYQTAPRQVPSTGQGRRLNHSDSQISSQISVNSNSKGFCGRVNLFWVVFFFFLVVAKEPNKYALDAESNDFPSLKSTLVTSSQGILPCCSFREASKREKLEMF